MVEYIGIKVHSYCEKCDTISETYTDMELCEFNNLHNIDPDTYEMTEDGEYILNHAQICNYCTG